MAEGDSGLNDWARPLTPAELEELCHSPKTTDEIIADVSKEFRAEVKAIFEADAKPAPAKRAKFCHIGAPACFLLEEACQFLNRAFDGQCYVVGSVLERPDWRDVDIRMMMKDDDFMALFPDVNHLDNGSWEFDARWIVLTTAISEQLKRKTGLPVDFQFQPMTFANKHHGRAAKKPRNPVGMQHVRRREVEARDASD